MRPFRNLKVASVIQEELSAIFMREFDFHGSLVTILEVAVDERLEEARITIAIFPFEKELEAYTMIEEKRKQLEYKLLRKLNIKPLPHLKFEIASKGEQGKIPSSTRDIKKDR